MANLLFTQPFIQPTNQPTNQQPTNPSTTKPNKAYLCELKHLSLWIEYFCL